MDHGLVISDLHLFSRRSQGEARLAEISEFFNEAQVLVLNGDIFDFRWSRIRPEEQAFEEAISRVHELTSNFEPGNVHYVLGNHDCLPGFVERLSGLSEVTTHQHSVQIGKNLFLHGDAANREMDRSAFHTYRRYWENDKPRSDWAGICYSASDRLKISHLFHKLYFPGESAITRIAWHLDQMDPGWREGTEHCFFGHTHVPFQNRLYDGIHFHNTGSAIQGMKFQALKFSLS